MRSLRSAMDWMSDGSLRLRRPDQINSVSREAKPTIIAVIYNATRYVTQGVICGAGSGGAFFGEQRIERVKLLGVAADGAGGHGFIEGGLAGIEVAQDEVRLAVLFF